MDEKKEEHQIYLPERDITKIPTKKNILLMLIVSIITLGIYQSFWYSKKVDELYNLGTQKKLSRSLTIVPLIINIFLIGLMIVFPLTVTIDVQRLPDNITDLQTGILFVISICLILEWFFLTLLGFQTRSIMNEALKNKETDSSVSGLFTLLFNVHYLQYEINKIIDDKENKPKTGPWAILIFIISIILSVFISSVI